MKRQLLGLLLAAATLPSCIPPPDGDVAIGLDEQGSTAIYLLLCPEDFVQEVLIAHSSNGIIGDDDDNVLWRVASQGRRISDGVILLGVVPDGFAERTPYQAWSPEEEVTLFIDGIEEEYVVDFRLGETGDGLVMSESSGLVSLAEFSQEARSDCD